VPSSRCYLLHAGHVPTEAADTSTGQQDSFQGLTLMTASLEDGVLPGVMRARVLQAAAMLGLLVQEQAPCWQYRNTWLEVFVSNALRGVQPVGSVMMPGTQAGAGHEVVDLAQACGPVTRGLQQLVPTLLEGKSIQA
jgi:branched-subunit amino acid aminotransferase/4-amino-4-deoxychorismate lyase